MSFGNANRGVLRRGVYCFHRVLSMLGSETGGEVIIIGLVLQIFVHRSAPTSVQWLSLGSFEVFPRCLDQPFTRPTPSQIYSLTSSHAFVHSYSFYYCTGNLEKPGEKNGGFLNNWHGTTLFFFDCICCLEWVLS